MHLISTLAAGVSGAESGHAIIRKRNTATAATYYSSFEGTVHSTSGANLVLDSSGRAVAYVNELVDVLVYDSSGTLVVSFTEGIGAGNIEIRSASFTGTDYDSAASAAGNPTTLQTVANLWKTNAGNSAGNSIDFKVTAGGLTKTLAQWMGLISGSLIYNVKDPTYGATGDGTTDDATSIQAAIDAASAAGGGIVFLPPGTYSVETTIDLKGTVSLVGAGMASTVLTMNHASNGLITTNANTYQHDIIGMRLTASTANTGTIIEAQGATNLQVYDCHIGGANCDATQLVDGAAADQEVHFHGCTFEIGDAAQDAVDCDQHTAGRWYFRDCEFITPATYNPTNGAVIYGNLVVIHECKFDLSASTSGTFSVFTADSTTVLAQAFGNIIVAGGGATITGYTLGTYLAASNFFENNTWCPGYSDSNFTLYSYTVAAAQTGAQVRLGTRETRLQIVTGDSAAVTLATDQFGVIIFEHTGTTGKTFSPTAAPEGASQKIVTAAGAGAVAETFNTLAPAITANTLTNFTSNVIIGVWLTNLGDSPFLQTVQSLDSV